MWSRSTFVIAATPPSQAWVASSRPPSPTSTSARSTPLVGEPAEDDGGQELELGRVAEAARQAVGGRDRVRDEPGERGRVDRPAGDLEPLAIRHEVRLRRLAGAQPGRPERRPGEGQDAALAVRAGDQRAADAELGIAELAEEGPRPAEPEPDPEPAPLGQRREGGVIGGRRSTGRPSVARSAVHSRLRSSS